MSFRCGGCITRDNWQSVTALACPYRTLYLSSARIPWDYLWILTVFLKTCFVFVGVENYSEQRLEQSDAKRLIVIQLPELTRGVTMGGLLQCVFVYTSFQQLRYLQSHFPMA